MIILHFYFWRVPLLAILVSSRTMLPFYESIASSIETDKEALISFMSDLSLEPSNSLSSWNQKPSPCNRTGVSCDRFGKRVVGLNLSSFRLSGSVSPYIANLSFLRSLELQNNQLTGTIPGEVCNLFRLRVMNMSSNDLHGLIMSNTSKLSELRVLDLSMNAITGRIPEELTSLTKLKVLNLGRNLLSGEIPPSLANLSSLEYLILKTNTLHGMIPSELNRLQNLKVLDLAVNNLTGTVPASIYNISSLVHLALASNQLWGRIPSNIGVTLPKLLVFIFCYNRFSGTLPGSLHNLTRMKQIRMAHNFLEGTVPPGMEKLAFLEMYNIGSNKIVSSGDKSLEFITSLTNSSRLAYLAFDENRLQGAIPESIGNLSKHLLKLYMGGNQFYGSIPASIGRLSGLTLLNMSYNSITGAIPREISQLKNLQMLVLAGNKISASIPDSLGNLRKLYQMDLSRNELLGGIPATFKNFHRLIGVDLSTNKLNGSIPKEILNLPSLSTIFNLSNNLLSGNLSPEIGLLKSVVTIDLSNNHFSGDIPSSIRDCRSLQELHMGSNSFSGPIPATLGEMKGLEILDLSYNFLSGFIPPDLENLQALQSLNLSFNDLEGVVPCGGAFANRSRVHLQGNERLSLPSACPNTGGHERGVSKAIIIIAVAAAATLALSFAIGFFFFMRRRARISSTFNLIKEQHQMVSYHQLRQATDKFDKQNLIGNGGFGAVYKGFLTDGSAVAVKVLDTKQIGSWKSFLAECEALRHVRHRNLVKLITSCSSLDFKNSEFLALVYEFLGNGSLEDWIQGLRKKKNGDGLNLMDRLNVVIDVATAIDYLHYDCEVPVVHCDLKPSNVILKEDMTAKVGDFGLARLLMENIDPQNSISSSHVLKGSIGYIPPEYRLGVNPSTAGDTYSFGVTLLELFTGKNPVSDTFQEGTNLARWVQSSFPSNILQVLDNDLILLMDDYCPDGETVIPEKHYGCLTAVLDIGLCCTAESPDRRISIRNALIKLKAARDGILRYPCSLEAVNGN